MELLTGSARERSSGRWIAVRGGATVHTRANSRFKEAATVYWRWATVYVSLLILGVVGDLTSCTLAPSSAFWGQIAPQLNYIGIVFAAIRFGVVGGLGSACIAGTLHISILTLTCGGAASERGQLAIFAVVGLIAGLISERKAPSSIKQPTAVATGTSESSRGLSPSQTGHMMLDLVHQFRTPIASIEGAGFVLEDPDLPEEKRQEFLAIVRRECRRLELLVELLHVTQSRSSDYQDVDLSHLVDEVISLCRPKADARIVFRNKAPKDLPRLRCNPELMKHAVHVLASNAIQAVPQVKEVGLSAHFGPSEVAIRIDANPEHLGRPLESHNPYNSTGIDLAVVQQIMNRYGGSVRVESTNRSAVSISMILPRDSWTNL